VITIVLSIASLLGFFAWVIAVVSAIRIVSLAPKGRKLATYGRVGWWQFDAIRGELGTAVEPHITAYQRAFIAFFALILVAMIVGTLLGATAQN
jgi:hypothetical protein